MTSVTGWRKRYFVESLVEADKEREHDKWFDEECQKLLQHKNKKKS